MAHPPITTAQLALIRRGVVGRSDSLERTSEVLAGVVPLTEARQRLAWAAAFASRPSHCTNLVHQNLSEDLWLMVVELLHRADERGVRAHAHARSLVKAYSVDAVRERLAADAAIAPLFGVSLRPGRWGALLLVLLVLASTVWRAPCTVAITAARVWLRRHTMTS